MKTSSDVTPSRTAVSLKIKHSPLKGSDRKNLPENNVTDSQGNKDQDRVHISTEALAKQSKMNDELHKNLNQDAPEPTPLQETMETQFSPYTAMKAQGTKGPGIFFITGFDFFGLSKDSDDGLKEISEAIPGSQQFSWDEKDKILAEIKKGPRDRPIVLVGHSLGGDTAVEIANTLNSPKHHFKNIDLLVTLDSFGLDNDVIPQNVLKSLNFIGDKDYFLNDSAHVARNIQSTEVINELRTETHSDLDNSQDVQGKIMNSILKMFG